MKTMIRVGDEFRVVGNMMTYHEGEVLTVISIAAGISPSTGRLVAEFELQNADGVTLTTTHEAFESGLLFQSYMFVRVQQPKCRATLEDSELRFKGGPIFLNSGGSGPDDYLMKPIKGGRWCRVIARWGRHFTNKGDSVKDGDAMQKVLHATRQICVGDNARQWDRGKGHIPTLCWSDFLAKYSERIL